MLKRLTNHSELRVYEQISKACDRFGAEVYRKIRIADVVDISQLDSREIGTFALQAHFDFIISDNDHFPLFALEFDGGGHDSGSDWKKDGICVQANLAHFRVNLHALNAQLVEMSFLQYLVHVWFMADEFNRQQERGVIPQDEPFVMWGFLKPDAKHIFDSEYEFTAKARGKINRLCKQHKLTEFDSIANIAIGEMLLANDMEKFGAFVGLNTKSGSVFGHCMLDLKVPNYGALGSVPFGRMALGDFVHGQAYMALADNIQLLCSGAGHTLTSETEILETVSGLVNAGYTMARAGGMKGHALSSAMELVEKMQIK